MAFCKLGHFYIIDTVLSRPPKEKYALCICVADALFVWVNSEPRHHNRDQLRLANGCHELIKHDSYMDLSKLFHHPEWELDEAIEKDRISSDLCAEILSFIEQGLDVLPPRHANLVASNLRTLIA